MPELPEIETIKRQLLRRVVAKKIQKIEILDKKLHTYLSARNLKKLTGLEIKKISRRAKVLLLELSENLVLAFHLKMSGQIIFVGDKNHSLSNKHTRAVVKFSDGTKLFFQDSRRFGWIKIFSKTKLEDSLFQQPLGPEPLEKEFSLEYLKTVLSKRRGAIKTVIMDQQVLAGVGNIYANEALFLAGVHPQRAANNLTEKEIKKLQKAIKQVLLKAISYNGSSRDKYRDIYGKAGSYQLHFLVYNRAGEKCRHCRSEIKRLVLAGRSSFFCPHCQK